MKPTREFWDTMLSNLMPIRVKIYFVIFLSFTLEKYYCFGAACINNKCMYTHIHAEVIRVF